jgi:thiol-disulfide isomerase/thioredoxin
MMVGMRRLAAAVLLASLAIAPAATAEDAPGFAVKLLDSRATFDSRERLGKRPVVVRFQASWCKACAREAPGFVRLAERYRARGIDFIALHVQDTAASTRRFVRTHRIAFPVALDPRLAIANTFEFKGTPATIVIDRKGAVAARIDGESAVTRLPRILDEVLGADRTR